MLKKITIPEIKLAIPISKKQNFVKNNVFFQNERSKSEGYKKNIDAAIQP
jgi:hypothetical protein